MPGSGTAVTGGYRPDLASAAARCQPRVPPAARRQLPRRLAAAPAAVPPATPAPGRRIGSDLGPGLDAGPPRGLPAAPIAASAASPCRPPRQPSTRPCSMINVTLAVKRCRRRGIRATARAAQRRDWPDHAAPAARTGQLRGWRTALPGNSCPPTRLLPPVPGWPRPGVRISMSRSDIGRVSGRSDGVARSSR